MAKLRAVDLIIHLATSGAFPITLDNEKIFEAQSEGDIFMADFVEPNAFDAPVGELSDLAVLAWTERWLDAASPSGATSIQMYAYVEGVGPWSDAAPLSLAPGGSPKSWLYLSEGVGDWNEGCFFFDPGTGSRNYLFIWYEAIPSGAPPVPAPAG